MGHRNRIGSSPRRKPTQTAISLPAQNDNRRSRSWNPTNMNPALRIMLTQSVLALLVGSLAHLTPPLAAQEDAAGSAAGDETEASHDKKGNDAEKAAMQAAKEHIARFKMRLADSSGDLVEPVDRPLLAYGEPARANSHGTLWAFGTRGRPVAFVELWQAADNEALWFQSVVRTGDQPLRLDLSDGKRWRPPEGKIARTAIKNAPRPSATKPTRLRQLKSLARQFTAHEFWGSDNSRAELRLLVQPVHRYDDAPAGLQDGAAFIFAHGTNPEIILLLEALGPTADQSRWHFVLFPPAVRKRMWRSTRTKSGRGPPLLAWWVWRPTTTGFFRCR
jgi:hypothetical protein